MERLLQNIADSFADVQYHLRRFAANEGAHADIPRLAPWIQDNGIKKLIQSMIEAVKGQPQVKIESQKNDKSADQDHVKDHSSRPEVNSMQRLDGEEEVEDGCMQLEASEQSMKPFIDEPSLNSFTPKEEPKVQQVSRSPLARRAKKTINYNVERLARRAISRRRRVYRTYHPWMKKLAIDSLAKGASVTKVSNELGISAKNIKRWKANGIKRKMGAGRKRIDPEMEESLYAWLQDNHAEGEKVDREILRQVALMLTSKQEFLASKGWLVRFISRYRIADRYDLI